MDQSEKGGNPGGKDRFGPVTIKDGHFFVMGKVERSGMGGWVLSKSIRRYARTDYGSYRLFAQSRAAGFLI